VIPWWIYLPVTIIGGCVIAYGSYRDGFQDGVKAMIKSPLMYHLFKVVTEEDDDARKH